jgi:nitronate monooxygenase
VTGHGPLHTALCERLSIRHPVLLAPMAGGYSTPELVAAVSEAGGMGFFGANGMTVEALRAAVRRAAELTQRPFGVNVLLAGPHPAQGDQTALQAAVDELRSRYEPDPATPSRAGTAEELLQLAIDEGVAVLGVGLGDPIEVVRLAHDAGRPLVAMAATADDLARCAEVGSDVVVAQGAEAGGHRSTLSLESGEEPPLVGLAALLPAARRLVDVPLVAAGAIGDGRGVAAALALGADGVQVGTLFMVAREAGTPPAFRRKLRAARDADSIVSIAISGRPARLLPNELVQAVRRGGEASVGYPAQRGLLGDFYAAGRTRDDGELLPLLTGQGTQLLPPEDEPAAAIVESLVAGARATIADLAQRFPS